MQYTPLKLNQTPTQGTSGQSVKDMQTSLNTRNAGVAGYIPLVVDGKYGKLTADARAIADKNVATPIATPVVTTDPVVSSGDARAGADALRKTIQNQYDNSGLKSASEQQISDMQKERDGLNKAKEENVARLKTQYEESLKTQEERQARDYGGQKTSLQGATVGYNSTVTGVLQNLSHTFDGEKKALESQRDSAIAQAQSAYTEKDLALASKMSKEANDYQNELYNRQKDYSAQQLNIAREARQQDEYDRGYTDEKIKAYGAMSDADFAKITPKQLEDTDKFLYAGATKDLRAASMSSAKNASYKSNLELRSTLQTLINKTPYGQKIPLPDGTFAVGLKRAGGGGISIKDPISSSLANQLGSSVLAGKSTKDIILQLELPNAPDWYKQIYASQNPEGWQQVKNNPNAIDRDWFNYRKAESFNPFRQTIDITKTTANQKESRHKQIQAGNPDTITPTTTPESDPDEDILNN